MARQRGPGLEAAVRNWPALVLLWAAGGALVGAYGRHEGATEVIDQVAAAKTAGGFGAVLLAGVVSGALMPEIAKALTRRPRASLRLFLFTGVVYSGVAVLVDVFYALLDTLIGPSRDPGTVLVKTLLDMLLFTPFLSIPFATGMFAWRRAGFRKLGRLFTFRSWRERVFPVMPLCWLFWTPALALTYSLPLAIQFPFAMTMNAAWSVMFVFMATREDAPVSPDEQA